MNLMALLVNFLHNALAQSYPFVVVHDSLMIVEKQNWTLVYKAIHDIKNIYINVSLALQ
jgi:hypothetical protein